MQTDTASWTKELTPEMRAELRELHKLDPWVTARKLALLLGIWAVLGTIAVSVDSLFIRIPCWIVMGFAFHGLGVFMHEGAHGMLFQKGPLDRIVGFLCGLPIFFSCSNYKATHDLHHKYENTKDDPDNLEANFPNPVIRFVVYYAWYAVGMLMYITLITATGPFRARTLKERALCVLETAMMAAVYYGLYVLATRYGLGRVLLNGWLMGVPFAIVVANVRGLAEHTQLWHRDPPDPLKSTRTTLTSPFVSFFFNNQNYHMEHHLFPRVPWYNLPKVHALLRPIYEKRQASVCKGYAHYVAGALKYGPNRTLSYRPGDHAAVPDPPRRPAHA